MPQLKPGRPEAAAAIWSWQSPAATRTALRKAAIGPARLRGTLQASAGLAVAGLLAWWGNRTAATVVGSVATFVLLSALLSPLGLFTAIERAFLVLGRWIGQGLTWTLLPVIFYTFFVPFSVLFRRGRRDSMKRFFDAEAATYWSSRASGTGRTASTSHERPY